MAIKRRERDNDGSKNFQMEDEHIPTDHELFLQAFESKFLKFYFSLYYYCFCVRSGNYSSRL